MKILPKYTIKFKPYNLNGSSSFKTLNEVTNGKLNLDSLHIPLLSFCLDSDIYDGVKDELLYYTNNSYGAYNAPTVRTKYQTINQDMFFSRDDNIMFDVYKIFPTKNVFGDFDGTKKTFSIIYDSNVYYENYVNLIRKKLFELVTEYIKKKYNKIMGHIYNKELSNKFIIYIQIENKRKILFKYIKKNNTPYIKLYNLKSFDIKNIMENVKVNDLIKNKFIALDKGSVFF
jgi:hypothetical protein